MKNNETLSTLEKTRDFAADSARSNSGRHVNSDFETTTIPNLDAIKARQKATWEAGDFGQVARTIENVAEEFMARQSISDVRLTRRIALMRYPFPPAETVEFFRQYYGPTQKAFASLDTAGQAALRRDLVALQTAHNTATTPGTTEVAAEYLEIHARR